MTNHTLTRTGLFAVYSLGLVLANRGVLAAWFDYSRADSSASHLILVPCITIALIYQSRASIFSSARYPLSARWTLAAASMAGVFAAVAQQTFSTLNQPLPLLVATFVVFWVAGFLLFYSHYAFRAARFPLLFLVFMVPIPDLLLQGVTRLLTTGSSEIVAGLFTLSGTPYHQEGFVFSLPTVTIHIADECSGIRSTIALILTGLLAAHMYLKSGWSKAVFVAVIFPLTLLKNGIRIATLTLLAVHVDPGYLNGRLHHAGGIVFFLLALAIAVPLFVFLHKRDQQGPSAGAGGGGASVAPATAALGRSHV